MAVTGQTGTQAPQSMHSSGLMESILADSKSASSFRGWMQSTGQTSTQAVSLVPIQGSAITYAMELSLTAIYDPMIAKTIDLKLKRWFYIIKPTSPQAAFLIAKII